MQRPSSGEKSKKQGEIMILIVGCGFLGSHLLNQILQTTNEDVLCVARNTKKSLLDPKAELITCDITDNNNLEKLARRCGNEPLTVFYFAACHNIDLVYEKPELARQTNIVALESFIAHLPNIKKLFFASTDCVYGEGKDRYFKFKETSPLLPINEYGRQKIEAEKIITNAGFNVVRLPFMLEASLSATPHFYDKIKDSLLNNETVEMIDGMYRSVLSYSQVAKILLTLAQLEEPIPPIINVCSDNAFSKYEMGCIIAKNLNVPPSLIHKISEDEGKKFFKDNRATNGGMDNTLVKSLLGIKTLNWEEEICC